MKNEAIFDLGLTGGYCDGTLCFEEGGILTAKNGEQSVSFSVCDYSELVLRTFVGCGMLELKPAGCTDDNSNVPVCRFTMSCVARIGEICKVVNHYLLTGEMTQASSDADNCCPHCGRHYMGDVRVCMFCTKKSGYYRRLLTYCEKYRGRIIFSLLFIILSDFAAASVPLLNGRVLDDWLYSEITDPSFAIKSVLLLCGVMALARIVSQFFLIAGRRIMAEISTGLAHTLRMSVYSKLQRMSLKSLQKKTAGDLMGRVTGDTEVVRDFISGYLIFAVYQASRFFVIAGVLFFIDPVLALLVLAPVPPGLFIFYKFRTVIHTRYMKQWRCERRGDSVLRDIVQGIRVVKSFGAEKREIGKFDRVCRQLADICVKNERLWAVTFPYVTFFIGIGEFLVLLVGGRMGIIGNISAGKLLEFTLFLTYIYGPVQWFSRFPQAVGRVNTSIIKIFEILDEKDEMTDIPALESYRFEDEMEFRDVRFGYTAYEPVLKDIDLKVKKGEMIGLVGRSGAGKSTLINLIMRLYETDYGTITADKTDIRTVKPNEYRGAIAPVFQQTFLFAGTVWDNIEYAKPGADPDEIIRAAKIANAHDFIMKLPDGYNTLIGENAHNLSGGEKQRIAIARAVLRDPEILILDEATSALDTETEKNIQEAMHRLIKGRTTFAIAHRLSTLRDANRLVVIDDGRVAEVGSHTELLKKKGIYADLVAAQHKTARLRNTEKK